MMIEVTAVAIQTMFRHTLDDLQRAFNADIRYDDAGNLIEEEAVFVNGPDFTNLTETFRRLKDSI